MRGSGAERVQGARQRGLSRRLRQAVRRRGALAAVFVGGLALPCLSPAARGAEGAPAPPQVPATAWILVDAADGTRLASVEPASSLAMASTTKLMTAYLALRELPLQRRLVAPPYHPIPGESLLGLEAGERISVRDLLYGLLLPSGNDAAVTLADGVAGSVPAFVGDMNRAAGRLGLGDTRYSNPIGLDQPGNYSSPRDLAKLALDLRRDRLFRRIVDTPSETLRTGTHPRTVVNRNDLVERVPWVNGVKTGYTRDAGNVLVGSGTRKGVTLVSVVMGAATETARDDDTLALLRYGFSLYSRETPVQKGERLATAAVRGRDDSLPLVAARSVQVTARHGQSVRVRIEAPPNVLGPIPRGRRLGAAVVTVDGEVAGRAPLLSRRAALAPASRSLVSRVDDAVPGPRAFVWIAGGGVAAAIVIGIVLALAHRRRHQGQPGQAGAK
jgi:serine-type D-Ala-D-Ala carboxypeptidase (penicillin-binding protein 5/6)